NLSGEARHAVRTALHDGRMNLFERTAVNPNRIHQCRTDSAATLRVTADAVICLVESLAFGNCVSALLIRERRFLRRRLPGRNLVQYGCTGGRGASRSRIKDPLLALTSDDDQR